MTVTVKRPVGRLFSFPGVCRRPDERGIFGRGIFGRGIFDVESFDQGIDPVKRVQQNREISVAAAVNAV